MAQPTISFDDLLRQSRQKRKAEVLAQEILGKNRRPRTPAGARPTVSGGSLASRVGVNKRTSSLPRSHTAPPRNGRRTSPPQLGRPSLNEKHRMKSSLAAATLNDRTNVINTSFAGAANGNTEISIRGAAGGPHVVVAQNFAPGTTAADIESVMVDVGGQLTDCHLIATTPTVIAEMTFVEKSGAEAVIAMFNNKKADGRTLYVYMKVPTSTRGNSQANWQQPARQPEPIPADETMEIDENAEAREAENRLREERRGRPDRGPRDVFPTGPRGAGRGHEDDYYRAPRRAEPEYQDGRYGFGGDARYGARDRYHEGDRPHSDDLRRGPQSGPQGGPRGGNQGGQGGQGWRR